MHLPTILIAVPCIMLMIIGLNYQVATDHLAYHKQVIATLGESVLEGKLMLLFQLSIYGACAIVLVVGSMTFLSPSDQLLQNIVENRADNWITAVLLLIVVGWGIAWILYDSFLGNAECRPRPAILIRRWSGVALVFFSSLVMLGVFTEYPPAMSACGGILTALLIYASVATRNLGRRAGAKTPWKFLPILATSSLLGAILAAVQI